MTVIPFARPDIDASDLLAVEGVLRSGWLTTGAVVSALEDDLRQLTGSKHAIAVNSNTSGLHLALECLDLNPGDEVIVPSMTFCATVNTVIHARGTPVFAECDSALNIDPTDVAAKIGPRTRAVMAVHYAGQPVDLDRLSALCEERGIALIEDSAHAIGNRYGRRAVGTVGRMGVFSFYANKNITSAEGGAVVTDDDAVALRIRSLLLHGMTRDAWNRFELGGTWRYDVSECGFKYNLPDVLAALGRSQLARLPAFQEQRSRLASSYRDLLESTDFEPLPLLAGRDHAWHLFVVLVPDAMAGDGRDQVIAGMGRRGVGTSVHYVPVHEFSYYRRRFPLVHLPHTERVSRRVISIPLYPGLTATEQERVVMALQASLEEVRG